MFQRNGVYTILSVQTLLIFNLKTKFYYYFVKIVIEIWGALSNTDWNDIGAPGGFKAPIVNLRTLKLLDEITIYRQNVGLIFTPNQQILCKFQRIWLIFFRASFLPTQRKEHFIYRDRL